MIKIVVIATISAVILGSAMYTKARYGEYLPDVREATPSIEGASLADTWRNFVGSMPRYSGTATNLR